MDYWVPGVQVAGVHELLGNALVMTRGERAHDQSARQKPLPAEVTHA